MLNDLYASLFPPLRYIFFACAMFGYAMLLLKKCNIKSEFIPVTVFSGIVLLMHVGGLLNMLWPMVLLITGLGALCLLWFLFKVRIQWAYLKKLFTPGMVIFLLASAAMFVAYRHARLLTNDDYSHWGLIVKQMSLHGRLPDDLVKVITFQSYPPGSALFIYYIIEVLGCGFNTAKELGLDYVEGKMLFAQGMLLFSCLLTLFPFAKTHRKALYCISIAMILAASVFLLTLTMSINTLFVDTLLPLVAVANTLVLLAYRDDLKRASLLSIPLMTLTLLIKHSGAFFFAVNALLLAVLAIRAMRRSRETKASPHGKRTLILAALGIAVPLLMLLLWHGRVGMVFGDNTGKHSMDLDRYEIVYSARTDSENDDIAERFLHAATDLKDRSFQLYIAWNVLLALCILGSLNRRPKALIATLIFGNLLYIGYQIGLLLTYLYTMSLEEAAMLASYHRYQGTVIQYLVGVSIAVVLFSWQSPPKRKYQHATDIALALLLALALCFPVVKDGQYSKLQPRAVSSLSLVDRLNQLVPDIEESPAHTYTIYISTTLTTEYIAHCAQYLLDTPRVEVVHWVDDEDEFWDIFDASDLFIILEEDDALREWMQPFGERESYIGIY